ncbi:hypothetical protein [Polyangium sp. 6x1]|uniref:hypothetical protein n=1 Tax=Polyangium sp. 6x1 TaxID=3042689 RepID=UPI002482B7C7|nr:hypothetical protein [Polyangium sp. 6x1]MDI1452187.1 hypothetical protein [Polyangium sp. 6x1]
MLDEQTTQICRYLHVKTFLVADAPPALRPHREQLDPEDIERTISWVRESLDPEMGRTQLYVDGGAGRNDLAEVTRSAMGTRDARGDFRALVSDAVLNDDSIDFPPYYGLCRATTLAVLSASVTTVRATCRRLCRCRSAA